MYFFSSFVIFIYFLFIGFHYIPIDGYQKEVKTIEDTKVKCKEVVDEALRQYWDQSKENPGSDNSEEYEESNDLNVNRYVNIEEEDKEDNSECIDEKEVEEEENKDNNEKDVESESEEQIDDKQNEDNDQNVISEEPNSDQQMDIENEKSDEDKSDERSDNSLKIDDNSEKNVEKNDSEEQIHRSRVHIDDILRVYEIGSQEDTSEQNLILSIFRELKKLYELSVKPLETIYKDAELFAKPMVLFLGTKSSGKTSLINYLLGIDSTHMQLNTGLTASYPHFTVLSYGENYTRLSPTELTADYTLSSIQQFGQQFLEHYIRAHRMPISLLQKMTIIDSPGLADQLFKSGSQEQQTLDNDVYQWFIDRSDVIYVVIDVNQLQLTNQLKALIEQLKGRDFRFILSKSDLVSHSQIVSMIGQLLWILSPIMPSERPPQVYALTTVPQSVYDSFIDDQEVLWLKDLSNQISGISRVESRIAALRRHAVRVRNHAKLVDCYLSTFYRNKGIFTFGQSSRLLATDITENPHQYRVYSGAMAGQSQNISRYDLPDPGVYREFFRSNPLIDFKPLTSTCSYFKGCPIDKLDITIAYQLPELVGKYKKLTRIQPYL